MKSIALVLPLFESCLGHHDAYVGVDRGALKIIHENLNGLLAIGDFDSCSDLEKASIQAYFSEVIEYNEMKDDTDTALAFAHLKKMDYEEITVYGAFQHRFDHALANYHLLINEDFNLHLIDEYNHAFKIKMGVTEIKQSKYKYCAFFSFRESVITLKGFKYPLNQYLLKPYDSLVISNEIIKDSATIESDQDLICILSNDHQI